MNRVMLRNEAETMFRAIWRWVPPDTAMGNVKRMFLDRHRDWTQFARDAWGEAALMPIRLHPERARKLTRA